MRLISASTVLVACLTAAGAIAGDWPQFRGPTGMGLAADRDLPLRWESDSLLWKAPLGLRAEGAQLDHNQSSPIVVAGRVIVTTAHWPAGRSQQEFPEQVVGCFQAADGKLLWQTAIPPGPWKLSDLRGGYAAPTPCSDGERIYLLFGSAVLAALDLEGRVLWRRELADYQQFDVAIAGSPIAHNGSVLLLCDRNGGKSTLIAIDGRSGEVKWERQRPEAGFAHSTPVLAEIGGKAQLLVAASQALQGLDPDSGAVRWWCDVRGDVCSPVYSAGLVYCDSGRGGPGAAVDPTGMGDVTKTHLRWTSDQIPEGLSSPVIVDNRIYRLHSPGVLKVIDLETGKQIESRRLEGVSAAASPFVTAEKAIYFASAGKTYVMRPGSPDELVATNDLGEPSAASAAVADGHIFLKGTKHLFCIGNK